MGSSDERWKACQMISRQGHIIAQHPELTQEIIDCCKNAISKDESGVVRYHACKALGRLAPEIMKGNKESLDVIADILIKAITSDSYDRVRRGAAKALVDLTICQKSRPDVCNKIRESICKVMENDKYDIVRSDCAVCIGKLGPPQSRATQHILHVIKVAPKEDKSELVRIVAPLMLCKLSLRPIEQLDEDIEEVERYLIQKEHWSYWMERECVVRAIPELGPMLTNGARPKLLDKVLNLMAQMTTDMVWDVRVAACDAFRDFAPPAKVEKRPTEAVTMASAFHKELRRRSVPVLQKLLKDPNEDVREAAEEALKRRRP